MKSYHASRTGLFLIELIISILFFVVSCVIIVQLFAESYTVSREAVSINNALLYTQNIAELFLGNDGSFEAVKTVYFDTAYNAGDYFLLLLFDKDWEPTLDELNAVYAVYSKGYADSSFTYVDIYVCKYSTALQALIASSLDIYDFVNSGEYIYYNSIKKYRR